MSAKSAADKAIQRAANSAVLMISLALVAAPIVYSLYLAGSVVSSVSDLSIYRAIWINATEGGTSLHGAALLILVLIAVLHIANRIIGAHLPVLERVVSLLLSVPVNLVLLVCAVWMAFLGYGKFDINITEANVNGGGYVLDWICTGALMYLLLFVRKV
jgi:hypothetical protein